MSPTEAAEVTAMLMRLRAAGAALRARPARETLGALAGALEAWRDPNSKARLSLDLALPEAVGFSREVVREGLAHALEGWTGESLQAVVTRELGGEAALDGWGRTLAAGFETTSVLLAGALPTPTLLAILAPLAVRSPVLVRSSSHDPITARVVAASLAEADPQLAACVQLLDCSAEDAPAMDAFLTADCVVATGSDETIAAVAPRIRPPRRLVAYGHRMSVAVLGPEALEQALLAQTCERLALDVVLWDQLGCLSPVAVYAVTQNSTAVDRVASSLASSLARAQMRLPRGRVPVARAAAFASERAQAELRAAAGGPVAVHGRPADAWCVVREGDASPRAAPLYRFVRVHPVADLDSLARALTPLAPHLAGVAAGGFGPASREAFRLFTTLGASRICPPGRMQAPPLSWHHDGRGLLTPLVRFTDLETG